MPKFIYETTIQHLPDQVYALYAQPGAFERLAPPWEFVRLLAQSNGMGGPIADGVTLTLLVGMDPLSLVRVRWVTRISNVLAPGSHPDPGLLGFDDSQLPGQGPFATWHHKHRFLPGPSAGTCTLREDITYSLGFWWLGPFGVFANLFGSVIVNSKLQRMFRYRHAVTQADLNQFYKPV